MLAGGAAGLGAGLVGRQIWWRVRQPRARVAIYKADHYDVDLVDLLVRGIAEFPATVARVKGARVVLKPNLVEYHSDRPINTDPRLVAAAAEAFREHGAHEVVVAEAPGHRRDTELLVEQSGMRELLDLLRLPFVDLNVDLSSPVRLPVDFTGMGEVHFSATVLGADVLVSMPKLKTHHWAAATLSMKNLFGTLPGKIYGWPKNPLHIAGIHQSIADLWTALRPGFAIVDGITGMEGDGPIMGTGIHVGRVVLGEHLPAVDATCARIMALDPWQIPYLRLALGYGSTISAGRIEQIGEPIEPVPFDTLPAFWDLQTG